MPPLKLKIGDVVWLDKSRNRKHIEEYVEPVTGPGPFVTTTRCLNTGDSVRIKRLDRKMFEPAKWDHFSKAAKEEYLIYAGYIRKDEFLTAVRRAKNPKPKKQRGPMKQGAD